MTRRKKKPVRTPQPERVLTASDLAFIGAAKAFEMCGPRSNAADNLTPEKRKVILSMTKLLESSTDEDFATAMILCMYRLGERVHRKE